MRRLHTFLTSLTSKMPCPSLPNLTQACPSLAKLTLAYPTLLDIAILHLCLLILMLNCDHIFYLADLLYGGP